MTGYLHLESLFPMAPCQSWVIVVDQKERKSPPHQNGMFLSAKLATVSNEYRSFTWAYLWVSLQFYLLLSQNLKICLMSYQKQTVFSRSLCRPCMQIPSWKDPAQLSPEPVPHPQPPLAWCLVEATAPCSTPTGNFNRRLV